MAALRTRIALAQKHLNQVFRRAVTKQLAFVFFMKANLVALHQPHKVLRCVAREGATTKLGVLPQKMFVRSPHIHVDIGEIAASTAGDAYLFRHLVVVVDHQYLQSLLRRHASAKQASCASTDDGDIKGLQGLFGGGRFQAAHVKAVESRRDDDFVDASARGHGG